jgi:anti-sigma B factor antagonist
MGGVVKASMFTGELVVADERTPWGAVIAASGELDIAGVPELRRRLEDAMSRGARRLVLDLSGITFIDSVSLAAIIAVQHRLGDDGQLVIATSHPYVLLILEAGGIDSVVEVFDTREEAEAALSG